MATSNRFAKGFLYGFAAGIEAASRSTPGTVAPTPGTALLMRGISKQPRQVLPLTPDPEAQPEAVLEAFTRACLSGNYVEASRWTLPSPLQLEGESLAPVTPWDVTPASVGALLLCHVDDCWRIARKAAPEAAAKAGV